MHAIRYNRKHPLKTRGRITDQIISLDCRGFTVINVDHVSYRWLARIFKVIILYHQGPILPGFLLIFELQHLPRPHDFELVRVSGSEPLIRGHPREQMHLGVYLSSLWGFRGYHLRSRLCFAGSMFRFRTYSRLYEFIHYESSFRGHI